MKNNNIDIGRVSIYSTTTRLQLLNNINSARQRKTRQRRTPWREREKKEPRGKDARTEPTYSSTVAPPVRACGMLENEIELSHQPVSTVFSECTENLCRGNWMVVVLILNSLRRLTVQ